ncbi:40S ribosomal protein S27 [Manis javanica]|nr:40S ribosomal protein S27 [Manis javanica]
MDVKCPRCYNITTVSSHAQTVILCFGRSTVLCQSTGRKRGCSFRRETIPLNIFWVEKKLRWQLQVGNLEEEKGVVD